MSSFFSRIQSYFKAEYTGRYIGIILLELIKNDPDVLKYLFRNGAMLAKLVKAKTCEPTIECVFHANDGRKRQADLAIVCCKDKFKPYALLEVKAEDDEREYQFFDYVDFSTKQKIDFTIFSKYMEIGVEHTSKKENINCNTLSYAEFAKALINDKALSEKPFVNLFIDYVKEMDLMFTEIAENDLKLLLARLLDENEGYGKTRGHDNIRVIIPHVFSSIINNQYVVTENISSIIKGYRSSIDFNIEHFDNDSNGDLESEELTLKSGGYLRTYTVLPLITSKAGVNDWLYVTFGIRYELKDKICQNYVYATISAKHIKYGPNKVDYIYRSAPLHKYNEIEIKKLFIIMITSVLTDALKLNKFPNQYLSYAKELRKYLEK